MRPRMLGLFVSFLRYEGLYCLRLAGIIDFQWRLLRSREGNSAGKEPIFMILDLTSVFLTPNDPSFLFLLSTSAQRAQGSMSYLSAKDRDTGSQFHRF